MMPFSSLSAAREYGARFSVRKRAPSYVNRTEPTPVDGDGVATMFNDVPIVARLMTEPFTRGAIGRSVTALNKVRVIPDEAGGTTGGVLGGATGDETGEGFTMGGATGGATGSTTGVGTRTGDDTGERTGT